MPTANTASKISFLISKESHTRARGIKKVTTTIKSSRSNKVNKKENEIQCMRIQAITTLARRHFNQASAVREPYKLQQHFKVHIYSMETRRGSCNPFATVLVKHYQLNEGKNARRNSLPSL